MPIVHGKKFAYTKKGIAAAQKHFKTKKKFKKAKASPVKKAKIKKGSSGYRKVYLKRKQVESPSKRLKDIIIGLKKNYNKANDKVLSTYSRLSPNTQKNLFRLQRMYSRWQHID